MDGSMLAMREAEIAVIEAGAASHEAAYAAACASAVAAGRRVDASLAMLSAALDGLHAAQATAKHAHEECVQFNRDHDQRDPAKQNPIICSRPVADRPRVRVPPVIDLPRYRLVLLRDTDARRIFRDRTAQACILEWAIGGITAAALGFKLDSGDHDHDHHDR